ncbi:hypothetical protein JCM3770_000684 [Rhodotorula araucariae]
MRTLDLSHARLWSWRQSPPFAPSSSAPPTSVATTDTPSLQGGFRPCSHFPSVVHAELLAAGRIPDLRLRRNDELVQWVGEADWIYKCAFELDKLPEEGEAADLVFEGLDTFATVFLNGKKVLEANNMYLAHRVPALSALQRGANELYLVFHSAFRRGRELEERALGRRQHWPCWNGDKSRVFVRKGGWNYGWDWGPTVMTAGPFRPVRLEVYKSRIADFWPRPVVSAKLEATLALSWKISDAVDGLAATARLVSPSGAAIRKTGFDGPVINGEHVWALEEDEVELWWTCGLGEQPLYTVEVDLVDMRTGAVLDSVSRKIGFRRLRILRETLDDPSEDGHTFLFEINNVPLFIGGSNWIPIDSVVTTVPKERYRRWLELARDGNQNMVRVWGGGMYEDQVFYEICDELGLLVWQDFAFACGSYPAHLPDFRASVEEEASQAVKRLRSHACLALFSGNNEDYQIAEAEGLEYDPEDHDGASLLIALVPAQPCSFDAEDTPADLLLLLERTNFPARELYERTFPRIVADLSDTFYWPGSPWGGKTTRDQTEGDVHVWDVWHGSQEPYQEYYRLGGRFVSEFGMEAAPNIRTINYLLDGDTDERFSQSSTMDTHNKADGFERRLALYLAENIRYGPSMEDYVYATQFVQAEAMASAFSGWRRRFEGGVGGAKCAGALVWQLNDVWPATSWAVVDYFLRPKPAYFAIKRALAPFALGARRYTVKRFPDRFSRVNCVEASFVDLWASSAHILPQTVTLEIEAFELASGKRVHHERSNVQLGANRSTELKTLETPSAWGDVKSAVVVAARLVDHESDTVLARLSVYPEPYKYLTFPPPADVNLCVKLCRSHPSASTGEIRITADRPIKGLVLHSTDAQLSDNFLDMVPGDEQVAVARILETDAHPEEPLTICNDSEFTIGVFSKWIPSWRRRGWKTADGKPVANQDLIRYVMSLLALRTPADSKSPLANIAFQKVKAHVGIEGNEQADRFANNGALLPAVADRDFAQATRENEQKLRARKAPISLVEDVEWSVEVDEGDLLDEDELRELEEKQAFWEMQRGTDVPTNEMTPYARGDPEQE